MGKYSNIWNIRHIYKIIGNIFKRSVQMDVKLIFAIHNLINTLVQKNHKILLNKFKTKIYANK